MMAMSSSTIGYLQLKVHSVSSSLGRSHASSVTPRGGPGATNSQSPTWLKIKKFSQLVADRIIEESLSQMD